MKGKKKEVRKRWLHVRLNDSEYSLLNELHEKTTSRELSDYARRVLLQLPVIVRYRNESADAILTELIRLKNELSAVGSNLNQAVHRLHTLDTLPQVKIWVALYEKTRAEVAQKIEEIRSRMNQIHALWSSK